MSDRTPHPDCVEYILEDGTRWAWSESNVQYEQVPQDGESFTLLRMRLSRLEEATKPFLRENPYSDFGSHLIRVTDAEFEKLRRLVE
jgi:hypothetical protein